MGQDSCAHPVIIKMSDNLMKNSSYDGTLSSNCFSCMKHVIPGKYSSHAECNFDRGNRQMFMPANPIRCGESIREKLGMMKSGWEKYNVAYVCCRVAHYREVTSFVDADGRLSFECFGYDGKDCLYSNFEPMGQPGTVRVPLKGATKGRPLVHPGTNELTRDFALFANSITLGSMYTLFYKICKLGVYDVRTGSIIFKPSKPDRVAYRFDIYDCFIRKKFEVKQKQYSGTKEKEHGLLTFEDPETDESVTNVKELLEKFIPCDSPSIVSNSGDIYSEFKKHERRISAMESVAAPVWIPLASSMGPVHGMSVHPKSLSSLRVDTVTCVVEQALHLDGGLKSFAGALFKDVIVEPVFEEFGSSTVMVNADSVNGMLPDGRVYVLTYEHSTELSEAISSTRLEIYETDNPEKKCNFFYCNSKFRILIRFLRKHNIWFMLKELGRGEVLFTPPDLVCSFLVERSAAVTWKQFYSLDDVNRITEHRGGLLGHDDDCSVKGSDGYRARADHGGLDKRVNFGDFCCFWSIIGSISVSWGHFSSLFNFL